jgi:hypothetical protein
MTRNIAAITLCLATSVCGSASSAFAQSAVSSACAILASRITPDVSTQATAASKFSLFKQIIQDSRYSSFATANSSTLDVGISVVDYVDGFLGTTSNASNWSTNWSKFLGSTYEQASSQFDRSTFESRWSVEVIKAIVSSCPGSGGFYGLLETVTPGRDAFTISLNGNGNWDLLGISALPSDKVFACGGDEKATNQAPIKYTNSHPLSCTKDPNTTLLITVHDSIHDVGPFTINSVADDLKIKLGEGQQQLDGLRGEILALTVC